LNQRYITGKKVPSLNRSLENIPDEWNYLQTDGPIGADEETV